MDTFKILVPVDFSEPSAAALNAAMKIAAARQSATVTALHVDPGLVPYYDEELGILEPTRFFHSLRMQAMENSVPWEVPVTELVVYGDPVARIVEHATEKNCDLIVIGSHGRTGIDRLVMGSVAEGVLRKAACPVLCVKPAPVSAPESKNTSKSIGSTKSKATSS